MDREELKKLVEEVNLVDKCLDAHQKVQKREQSYRDSYFKTMVAGENVSNTRVEAEIVNFLVSHRGKLNEQIDNFCK